MVEYVSYYHPDGLGIPKIGERGGCPSCGLRVSGGRGFVVVFVNLEIYKSQGTMGYRNGSELYWYPQNLYNLTDKHEK